MKSLLMLSLILVVTACSAPPVEFDRPFPILMLAHDLEPGRSVSTPLDNGVVLCWHGIVEDRITFELYNPKKSFWSGRDYYLRSAAAGLGDVLPFDVGQERLVLEVLAVDMDRDTAFEKFDLRQYDKSRCDMDKYSVIKISRRL